jgi:hypothetical protein
MKRVYGEERTKNKQLIQVELLALEKLHKIKAKLVKLSRHDAKIKAVTVNPFLTIMYKRLSFKAWLSLYRIYLNIVFIIYFDYVDKNKDIR